MPQSSQAKRSLSLFPPYIYMHVCVCARICMYIFLELQFVKLHSFINYKYFLTTAPCLRHPVYRAAIIAHAKEEKSIPIVRETVRHSILRNKLKK